MPCTPGQVTSHLLINHLENRLRKTRFFTQLTVLAFSVFAGTSAQAESCPTEMTEWGSAYGARGFDGVQYGEHGGDSEAAKVVDNDQAGESACLKSGSKLESGR